MDSHIHTFGWDNSAWAPSNWKPSNPLDIQGIIVYDETNKKWKKIEESKQLCPWETEEYIKELAKNNLSIKELLEIVKTKIKERKK